MGNDFMDDVHKVTTETPLRFILSFLALLGLGSLLDGKKGK